MTNATAEFTVQLHFANRDPIVRAIYDKLLIQCRTFGPVVEAPRKTSIHLENKSAFAGVATRKAHLVLTIKANAAIKHKRIHKSERVSAARYHHEVKLASPTEVDAELVGWLRDAYALSA